MEAAEILALIGFEPEEGVEPTLDHVREYHNQRFLNADGLKDRPDLIEPFVKSALGQRLGSAQTKLISGAKELGLDFSHSDFEGKPIEDAISTILTGAGEKLKGTKKADSELEKKLAQIQGEYNDFKESVNGIQDEKTQLIQEFAEKEKGWKVGYAENEAWKTVSYSPTIKELEKLGFESKIKNTYKSQVDDKGEVFPVYASGEKQGRRVQNPAKISEELGWKELLSMEAKNSGVLPDAHAGKPTKPTNGAAQRIEPQPRAEGARGRPVHPNAGVGNQNR